MTWCPIHPARTSAELMNTDLSLIIAAGKVLCGEKGGDLDIFYRLKPPPRVAEDTGVCSRSSGENKNLSA